MSAYDLPVTFFNDVIETPGPEDFFASGNLGAWFDPSDFSSLFQDAAGTTPVTAVGDPIGRMNSQGGLAAYASQGTAGDRPVLALDAEGYYYVDTTGGKSLTVTFPIGLGSTTAHIHYAYRGFGSAYLTGQTVDTSYSITAPMAGLVITDIAIYSSQLEGFKEWANSKCAMTTGMDYCVDSVSGNDSNSGRTPFSAKRTIGALPALRNGMGIGLMRGSTWPEQIGTPNSTINNVTIRGCGVGRLPILDGAETIAASWSKTAGRTNVYQITVDIATGLTCYPSLWEDDARLRWKSSVANVDSSAGSYYVATTAAGDTTATIYCYPTGGGDPTSNGKVYKYSKRHAGIVNTCSTASYVGTASGWDVRDVHVKRGLMNDGAIAINGNLYRVLGEDGVKHELYVTLGGNMTDCIAWKHDWQDRDSHTMFVAFNQTGTGKASTFLRCIAAAEDAKFGVVATLSNGFHGFYAHTAGTDKCEAISMIDCSAYRVKHFGSAANCKSLYYLRCFTDGARGGYQSSADVMRSIDCFLRDAPTYGITGGGIDVRTTGSVGNYVEGFRLARTQSNESASSGWSIGGNTDHQITFYRCSIFNNQTNNFFGTRSISPGPTVVSNQRNAISGVTYPVYSNMKMFAGDANSDYNGYYVSGTMVIVYNNTTYSNNWSGFRAAWPNLEAHSTYNINPSFADPANGDFTVTNVNFPQNVGCERPVISYTAIPSLVALAAM